MDVTFTHQWLTVDNGAKPYFYGDEFAPGFRSSWAGPAVYRWNVYDSTPGDLRIAYVGETQKMSDRLSGYKRPGPSQQTNLRLKAHFGQEVLAGRQVLLEVLMFSSLEINGLAITPADLTDKAARRLIESLAILLLRQDGFELLNV
jgi:hypothetical protein